MLNVDDTLVCYKLKVRKSEVEGLRRLARGESVRVNADVTWGDLVRDSIRWMLENRRPVGR